MTPAVVSFAMIVGSAWFFFAALAVLAVALLWSDRRAKEETVRACAARVAKAERFGAAA